MPTFSIIIPTFGRQAFLTEALNSVLRQTVDDLEIIVVDDGSPEPIQVPEHPRVRLVRSPSNNGVASARNLGVIQSSGRVLTFLDDDDTWHPQRLEMAIGGLARAPVAVCWQSARGRILDGWVHHCILDSVTPSLGATALLREQWAPLNESYRSCEDILWWLDVTHRAEVATTPQQGLFIRRHAGIRAGYGTEQRIRDSDRLLSERLEYFQAHPRATSFRHRRIALMSLELGDRARARRSFLCSLRVNPNLRDVVHLCRTVHP